MNLFKNSLFYTYIIESNQQRINYNIQQCNDYRVLNGNRNYIFIFILFNFKKGGD